MYYKKSQLHALLELPRLFDFGKFTSIEKTVTQTYIVFFLMTIDGIYLCKIKGASK